MLCKCLVTNAVPSVYSCLHILMFNLVNKRDYILSLVVISSLILFCVYSTYYQGEIVSLLLGKEFYSMS